MICAIICRCGELLTEIYPHPLGQPAFICRKCNHIVEPPDGMRGYSVYTELPSNKGEITLEMLKEAYARSIHDTP